MDQYNLVINNNKLNNLNTKKIIIDIDKKFFRPTEVDFLKGNFSKAKKYLKWKPEFNTTSLIDSMINEELLNKVK